MPDEKVRRPACHGPSVKGFKEREQERRFAGREHEGRHHVARPMRPEIDPRPGDGEGDKKIEPTSAPKEKGENDCNGHVIGHMAGGERRTRPFAIARFGIANFRLLEQGEKCRARRFQLYHSHGLHLFRSTAIDKFFQHADR